MFERFYLPNIIRSMLELSSRQYFKSLGDGQAVSAFVLGSNVGNILLKFERKIGSSDVEHGKLIPTKITEEVKHRGGKRFMTLQITHEDAEALQHVLGGALKESRRNSFVKGFRNAVLATIFSQMNLKNTKQRT